MRSISRERERGWMGGGGGGGGGSGILSMHFALQISADQLCRFMSG